MGRLDGKRVLVTQADDYMGPIALELFAEEGAKIRCLEYFWCQMKATFLLGRRYRLAAAGRNN
jgi:hypothetical protein